MLLGLALWESLHGDPVRASQLLATVATGQLNDQTAYRIYRRCREHIRAASLPSQTIKAARTSGANTTIRSTLVDEFRQIERFAAGLT